MQLEVEPRVVNKDFMRYPAAQYKKTVHAKSGQYEISPVLLVQQSRDQEIGIEIEIGHPEQVVNDVLHHFILAPCDVLIRSRGRPQQEGQ